MRDGLLWFYRHIATIQPVGRDIEVSPHPKHNREVVKITIADLYRQYISLKDILNHRRGNYVVCMSVERLFGNAHVGGQLVGGDVIKPDPWRFDTPDCFPACLLQ